MNYNKDNLVVYSELTQLEDNFQKIIDDINGFSNQIKSKYSELGIEYKADSDTTELLNKLQYIKSLSNEQDSIFNGEATDITTQPIGSNEVKIVVAVKPGDEIELSIGLLSFVKSTNAFQTGANQFLTVDWGDGAITQGYSNFRHVYHSTDNMLAYNNTYKQAIITIRPTGYLDDEDILIPRAINFSADTKKHVLGYYQDCRGTKLPMSENSSTSNFSLCHNLRYVKINGDMSGGVETFKNCYTLKTLTANNVILNSTSWSCFIDCISLESINADISYYKNTASNQNRSNTFSGCCNLSYIKSLTLTDQGLNTLNYDGYFKNCFKLNNIPGLMFECETLHSTINNLFFNCASMENPFKYLRNTNMLPSAGFFFAGCSSIRECPDVLDLSLATNAESLFARCINMENTVKTLYLDNATKLNSLFADCYKLKTTPLILTAPKATDVAGIFARCLDLETIRFDMDFPKVDNGFSYAFDYCLSLTAFDCNYVRLGNLGTASHLDTARALLKDCVSLKKFPKSEFSIKYLDTTNTLTYTIEEFSDTINLTGPSAPKAALKTNADVKKMPTIINVTGSFSVVELFSGSANIKEINNLTINFENRTSISSTFKDCFSLKKINNLTINAPNATDINAFFYNCNALEEVNGLVFNISKTAAINMNNMFYGCRALKRIPDLGFSIEDCAGSMISTFAYSGIEEAVFEKPFKRITTLEKVFEYCRYLRYIKLDSGDTPIVAHHLFYYNECALRKVDIRIKCTDGRVHDLFVSSPAIHVASIKLDLAETKLYNNANFSLSNYFMLNEVQILNVNNTSNLTFDNLSRLKKVRITYKNGVSGNIYIRNGSIPSEGLNEFFRGLPNVSGKTLYLKGQSQIGLSDTTIATAKGWTINTTT